MTIFQSVIIAIIEGITEFLPVSSTGHMIIGEKVLGVVHSDFVSAYTVNIQFGAILSVVFLYWRRFLQNFDFYIKLMVAFLPAAVFGLIFSDIIDELLENVEVVAVMLVLGGVILIFVDKWFKHNDDQNHVEPSISHKTALTIGLFQVIAMIPGVSRSAATIIGGMTQKLSRKTAAEFSFFLAVPTMAAASGYKLLKLVSEPDGAKLLTDNLTVLIIGNVVAFIVATIAIKTFIHLLTQYGFKWFGYYRIILGLTILAFLGAGYDLNII